MSFIIPVSQRDTPFPTDVDMPLISLGINIWVFCSTLLLDAKWDAALVPVFFRFIAIIKYFCEA